jgi:hypothetical protein
MTEGIPSVNANELLSQHEVFWSELQDENTSIKKKGID